MARVFVLKAFLFAGLRRLSRFYPVKSEVLRAARRAPAQYECATCKKLFHTSEVVVDHIEAVIDPAVGFTTWDNYIARLFCPASNLQVLCKPDHDAKTKAEMKVRKVTRLAKKAKGASLETEKA